MHRFHPTPPVTFLPLPNLVVFSYRLTYPATSSRNARRRYYYRGTLNVSDPAADLAARIQWSAQRYKQAGKPLFLLVFGGLGLYGGHDDVFLFLHRTLSLLPAGAFQVIGAQEMARLARL